MENEVNVPGRLPETRVGKGPQQGDSFGHSYCMKCNRVIYNIEKYGPMTPHQINRTFCVCSGRVTGMVTKTRKVYGLEDIKSKEFLKP